MAGFLELAVMYIFLMESVGCAPMNSLKMYVQNNSIEGGVNYAPA